MKKSPRTARGTRTRQALLDAAEQVFSEYGYSDASIVRITERAGVGQGTFYLYFDSKLQIFEELVEDLNRRVRHAMAEHATPEMTRLEREREGFRGFFRFTAEHPALYRIVREAEFVSPRSLRLHYTRIVEGYIEGLKRARDAGEVGDIDPAVAAWALMGVGEMIGMRWVLWGRDEAAGDPADPLASGTDIVPEHVFDHMMQFIERALDARSQSAMPREAEEARS
jgi:AcrR family transcriptional regulator